MLTYPKPGPIVTTMRAIFLADAHLYEPSDPNYQAMLAFLEEQCGKTDTLVLLGDIFEFWIGKASVVDAYVPVIDALERMHQQGTKLVYVEGNHDFHLGPVFTDRLACQVLPEGGSIELDAASSRAKQPDHGDCDPGQLQQPEECGGKAQPLAGSRNLATLR